MTHWFAEGDTPDGPRRVALSGAALSDHKGMGPNGPLVRVGDGPPDQMPASLMPAQPGRVADLTQHSPLDRISGWVRLWLLGLIEERPGWDGVVCATYGDQTHWIELSANEAVSCRSAITLRLGRVLHGGDHPDEEALAASISRPERLASDLYVAERAQHEAAVTGHLLGAELAAMRPYWLGREVAVLSDQPALYSAAMTAQGVAVSVHSPEALLRAGLAAIARAQGFSR